MMGGATTNEDCIKIYDELKMKTLHRFVIFKIEGEKEVVVDQKAGPEATWDDFTKALPKTEARFAVFDYKFKTAEQPPREISKIIFIYWSPDEGSARPKMVYAITKEDFKKKLIGIAKDLQANSWGDLDQASIEEFIKKV